MYNSLTQKALDDKSEDTFEKKKGKKYDCVDVEKAKARRLLMQRVIFGGLNATPMPPDFFSLHDKAQGSLCLRRKKYNIISGRWEA
jgi:hypothetical protein